VYEHTLQAMDRTHIRLSQLLPNIYPSMGREMDPLMERECLQTIKEMYVNQYTNLHAH